jgi:hypothetical protein
MALAPCDGGGGSKCDRCGASQAPITASIAGTIVDQAGYFNGQAQGSFGPVTGPVMFNHYVVSKFYWTSTTDAADPSQAWTICSSDFGVYNPLKSDARQYALAVR